MTILNYKYLYRAYLNCRKNKRQTAKALECEINLEENLKKFLPEGQSYAPGGRVLRAG